MRGIKAVFFVAFALCFISAAFALNCNNGEDAGAGVCMCQSGYIPDDNCATKLGGATNCNGAALSYTEANHFPSLDVVTPGATKFTSNHLYAQIQGEYVVGRQYKQLVFTYTASQDATVAARQAKCALAGDVAAYWTQATTPTACNDTFYLNLPWVYHPDCGFANNTKLSGADAENMYITGYFHISYLDQLGEVENFTLTRSTSVPYSITVKFQRHVTVTLAALNVTSDVRYGMALTEDVFDPTTEILTLELTTIVNWPNQFYTAQQAMTFYRPPQVLVQKVTSSGALANGTYDVYPQDISCETAVENSPCRQSFTFQAKTDQTSSANCTFDGAYFLEINLYTCRAAASGDQPTCTHTLLNISFTITDSNVCGEIDVTPSVSGELISFPNSISSHFRDNIASKTSFFKLGTYANFFASIQSDNNEISIVFTNIKFQVHDNGQTSNQWTDLYTNDQNGHIVGNTNIINVFDNAKYFNIYFHSSVFAVAPNSRVVYTFSATATVSFMGNDGFIQSSEKAKRTVEYTWTQATAEAETNVFLAGASNSIGSMNVAEQTPAGVNSVTFVASVVGAVAGTMIIVFVVVGFILRSKSSKKDEASSALMAASAAASEVANRA